MEKQGNIRIASENMMPIIKKWLYSEKDIFLREIVANAQDAITKHQKLVDLGEAEKAGQRDGRFLSHPRRRRIFQERASGRGAQLRRVPPPPLLLFFRTPALSAYSRRAPARRAVIRRAVSRVRKEGASKRIKRRHPSPAPFSPWET